MTAQEILQVLQEAFGRNIHAEVSGNWVQFSCPLSPWTHDRGRDRSPSAGLSIAPGGTSVFHCLSGETRVLTRNGPRSIASLAGSSPELLMPDGTWMRAPVSSFGIQELRKITLSRNGREKVVYATANHRWFAKSGPNSYKEWTTDSLRPGMQLQSAVPCKRADWTMDSVGVLHGLVFGDGTRNTNRPSHGRLHLFSECMDLAIPLARSHGLNLTLGLETEQGTSYHAVSGQIGHMKELPDSSSSDSYLLGFLSGLIAADGHVDRRGNVSLASSSMATILAVQDICARLDIAVYGIGTQERVGLGVHSSLIHTIRFVPSTLDPDFFTLPSQKVRLSERLVRYERLRWQVAEVTKTSRVELVYCAQVPEYHAFVLEGNLVTGNCFSCKNTAPAHAFLRKYSELSGEDLSQLIGEVEEQQYLGPRELPSWEDRNVGPERKQLAYLDKDVFLGIYESAAGHPYLETRGIGEDTARLLSLLVDPSDPDDGEERILFPVFGINGDLHGLSGRATRKGARLKVRDYFGLVKSQCLLGAHLIRPEHDKVLLVEGLFDYANAWQCGMPAVAAMHSSLTKEQAALLLELDKPVYLFLDDDKAGASGVEIAGELLCRNLPVLTVKYPKVWIEDSEGGHWLKDPGELTKEEFESMVHGKRLF